MNQIQDRQRETNEEKGLKLQAFCDMDQLYKLLDNWSKSCGMAAMIVDAEGNPISADFGMTEFCRLVQSCDRGRARCVEIWKEDMGERYECPFGFWDFSIPIRLPNGQALGKVLAGQALTVDQKDEQILQKTAALGIDEQKIREVLSHVHRKTEMEMQGAYLLLKQTLSFFVEKSYSIWKAKNELKKVPGKKDRILSQITKIMYSYNLMVDLETEVYSLIQGTGMERTIAEYQKHSDFRQLRAFHDSVIHPDYLTRFHELTNFESARSDLSENGYKGSFEYPVLYPGDTEYEWHEINVFIGTQEDGSRLANILGRDITQAHNEQERHEKELRAAAAKNEILSELTKILYSYNLTLNLHTGKYSLIVGNGMPQFMEIFKSTDDYETAFLRKLSYVTESSVEDFSNFSSLAALRNRKKESGYIGNLEYSTKTEKGIEWHEINIFMGTDENGNAIANILGRDITEAHDKADTKAQLEIANASNAAKTAFLFNMSHDIRTPMNAIIGFTELLERHLDDRETALSYIKKIKTSNGFLLSLINNVLEMAKIESGKATLDETYWDAHTFNDTLFSLFDSQMKEKGIEFTREKTVIHKDVLCDETKLREIFLNILSNALKYTPPGGKVSMVLTEIPSDRPGYAMYQTVIEDTGIGMSQEFLPHLFEEFTRERSSTESKLNGTGLGMPIVKKLVDLMEGTIQVESQVGKGTKITVTLPHRIAQKADPISEKTQRYDESIFQGKRILLAEDNELNAEIAITILEEAGFMVEHAADGVICVDKMEKAEAGYYDLILMDIQMPNMDGYKATQTIRKLSDPKKAGIAIVAMTANAFEEDKANAYKAGMNWHIAKPIEIDTLMSALTEILKGQEKTKSFPPSQL